MRGQIESTETLPQRVGNRRATIRYRCAPASTGAVFASDDHEFQRAWIDNISCGGIGLFLSKPIADGSVIAVQLKSSVDDATHQLNGQVIHSNLREPFGWYIGIQFVEPISADTLDSLL